MQSRRSSRASSRRARPRRACATACCASRPPSATTRSSPASRWRSISTRARARSRWPAPARSGSRTCSLRDWPFEAFSRAVVASVVARDGARNESGGAAAAMEVTRLRWVYDAGVPMSAPAVMTDGTVVVGRYETTDQLAGDPPRRARRPGRHASGLPSSPAPPVVGAAAIWVASSDGLAYAVRRWREWTVVESGARRRGRAADARAAGQRDKDGLAASQPACRSGRAIQLGCADCQRYGDVCVRDDASCTQDGEVIVASGGRTARELFRRCTNGALRANWTGMLRTASAIDSAECHERHSQWTTKRSGVSRSYGGLVQRTRPSCDHRHDRRFARRSARTGLTILRDGERERLTRSDRSGGCNRSRSSLDRERAAQRRPHTPRWS